MIFIYIIIFLLLGGLIFKTFWERKNAVYDVTFIAAPIGAGKSCYSAMLSQKYLHRGWNVYSTDYIKNCRQLDIETLKKGFVYPEHSLLIIDESACKMNSRGFSTIPAPLLYYFKMCRHYKNKVILISQTFNDTDKQVREQSGLILFIRPIVRGLISMTVRVKSGLGVDMNGDIKMNYKIGKVGKLYFMPFYFKYFNSFSRPNVEVVNGDLW